MRKFPEPIQYLVSSFTRLPGVGPKTALRYVFSLLKQPQSVRQAMIRSLQELDKILICDQCYTYTTQPTCEICQDEKRDDALLCVVEESRDIATIESTGAYKGRYHVLGGVLNPIEGMTPDVIRFRELNERLKERAVVSEIILALSPTTQGETTMMYLSKHLAHHGKKITRLARGLPIGATIEFADEITLGDALKGRRE